MTFKERYATDLEFRERVKARSLASYHAHRDARIASTKAWKENNKDRVRAKTKDWRKRNIETVREQWNRNTRRRWADPEGRRKLDARCKVAYAVKIGRLVRPKTCSNCKRKGFIEAHHPDYDKPLDVIWLCPSCHRSLPADFSGSSHIEIRDADGNVLSEGDISV